MAVGAPPTGVHPGLLLRSMRALFSPSAILRTAWSMGLDPAAPPSYRRRSDHTLLVLHGGGAFGIAGFFNPRNNDQVLERARDIQHSSKTRFNTTRVEDLEQFNEALRRVLARLPTFDLAP